MTSEPALDENDFERYLKSLTPLMLPERDVLWVLACRTDTNAKKIKLLLRKNGFKFQYFHLVYDLKKMEWYGYFQTQPGIANSRSHELMFLC